MLPMRFLQLASLTFCCVLAGVAAVHCRENHGGGKEGSVVKSEEGSILIR